VRTPIHEPTKSDSISTRSSTALEQSTTETGKSTRGPYSLMTMPPPPA
jgi:hypothetical protein